MSHLSLPAFFRNRQALKERACLPSFVKEIIYVGSKEDAQP
jgi:hypothetical protein